MFSRKSSQKPTKQPIYPAGKYSTQSSSSIGIPPPAPPLSRLSSVKPIPPLQSSQYPSSNSFYQNILSGLGLGMGASLGRGIVDKGLGSHTNDEVNCAMDYIHYFVNPTDVSLNGAALSATEQNIISQSINTINSWNVLCEQGVSIAMSNNPDIQYIQQANNSLKNSTSSLVSATNLLKSKLSNFNIL